MSHDELEELLAEQTAYCCARAGEYDETSAFEAGARTELIAALEAFAPRGRVLELACGTGEWTVELVKYASQLTRLGCRDSNRRLAVLLGRRQLV
ncbi:MAG: hypothetical protein ABI323_11930 [Solirubrobacteraceae bacterium]